MKNVCFLLTMILLMSTSYSQVTIQAILPSTGMVQRNQLWNILIVNSSANQYNCRLDFLLRDRNSNAEVLTGTSSLFVLAPGAKQVSGSMLNPIQYNYLASGLGRQDQGLLPVGNYTICYTLSSADERKSGMAEDCLSFDVEPLSPPMLTFPSDSAVLTVSPAQFTWVPPVPLDMFSNLHYELIIAPVNEKQQQAEAIQENIPFYSAGNIINNSMSYSAALPSFEKDKWYSWQVIAKDDKNYAAKSETWVFKVGSEQVKAAASFNSFIKVKLENPEVAIIQNGLLKLEYTNEMNAKEITISVLGDESDRRGNKSPTITIPLKAGSNFIEYDLNKIMKPQDDKLYQLMLQNSNGDKTSIRILVKILKTNN